MTLRVIFPTACRDAKMRLCGGPVIDDELESQQIFVARYLCPEQRMHAGGKRCGCAKRDRGEAFAVARQRKLGMAVAHRSLIGDIEDVVECGRRKSLAPCALAQARCEIEREFSAAECAVAFVRTQ